MKNTVYVVEEVSLEYNDEYYYQVDGINILGVCSTLAEAEKIREQALDSLEDNFDWDSFEDSDIERLPNQSFREFLKDLVVINTYDVK